MTQKFLDSGELCGDSAEEICDICVASFRGLWLDWCIQSGAFDLIERTKFYIKMMISVYKLR